MLTFFVWTSATNAQTAELVWPSYVEKDHYQIMGATFDGTEWTAPTAMLKLTLPVKTPTLVTLQDGDSLLIWTEQRRTKSVLMQARRPAGALEWSAPSLIIGEGTENLQPSAVVDGNGQLWLFWVSHFGELTDIFLSRYGTAGWSEPQQVNADNKVPDHSPTASIDNSGHVQLSWQSYSFTESRYIELNRRYKVEITNKTRYKSSSEVADEVTFDPTFLPGYVPTGIAGAIHFPNNPFVQSIRVGSN